MSWDFLGGQKVDLDATIVMINDIGDIVDAVYYNKLRSDCGSIVHSGDQRDGTKEGYDEVISINLTQINYQVSYLALLISSFNGQGF